MGSDARQSRDVIVVGGGVVGLATALALAALGREVALIERLPPPDRRFSGTLGFDTRTVALTPRSVQLLTGLLPVSTAALPLTPIRSMFVWEVDGGGKLAFEHPDALAHVAENGAIIEALWRAALERVEVIAPASVTQLHEHPGRVSLQLEGPAARAINARLVVAADGANSAIAGLCGADYRQQQLPYRGEQRAIATVARLDTPHGNRAWQRFGKTGPVALLPLADPHTVAVIWSASKAVNARLAGHDDAAFADALTAETEALAGTVLAIDRRASFPLRQAFTDDVNPSSRVLLAGDAARTLHPLAGQGVNIGLEDTQALVAEAKRGGDLGAAGRWRLYANARRRRSKAMIAAMHALLAAYCGKRSASPTMRLARNSVIRALDASAYAKAALIRDAMGIGALARATGAPTDTGARRQDSKPSAVNAHG